MASSPKAPAEQIDSRLVRKLADILNETGLSEIEVEHGDLKIRVARAPATVAYAPAAAPVYAAQPAAPQQAADAPAAKARPAGDQVKSPMVGTVYLQPQPDSPPFVKLGDTVSAGQTLMIIEAMKTMNPVPATKAGKIVEILVGDAQPVEFGEPLVIIE